MTGRVHLSAPDIGELEEQFVLGALRSGWVAPTGPDVDAFEREVADRVGVVAATAVSSGTAGLHLALLSIGVSPGDVVIVPTFTFAATANAVVYTGAQPVFVDCDATTGNVDVDLVAELLARLRRRGRPAKAMISVDMFGSCVDYSRLIPLCSEHGVPLIEDAAEALGATYHGKAAGSFGRVAVVSFNGNKIMTTSGGGMVLSDDETLVDRCRYLATQARQPVAHFEHHDIGYNYRLSNLLAALGRAQLLRLDEMLARRRSLRDRYAKLFAAVPGVRLLGADDLEANCWLTTIIVEPQQAGWTVGELAHHLATKEIETRPAWKPMHLQPVHTKVEAVLNGAADRLFANGLVLPSGSGMNAETAERVFVAIEGFLERR